MQGDKSPEPAQQKNTPVAVEKPTEPENVKTVAEKKPIEQEKSTEQEAAKAVVEKPKEKGPPRKPKTSTNANSKTSTSKATKPAPKAKPKTEPTKPVASVPVPAKPVASKPEAQPTQPAKPTVEVASGPTGKIVFEKQGPVDAIYLVGNSKTYKSGSSVPVGNYKIKIKCGGNTSDAGKHSVKENKTSTYACNCMMRRCQSK